MLLAFDVGNSHTAAGVFNIATGELVEYFRVRTNRKATSDEMGMLFAGLFDYHNLAMNDVKDVIISSVVPQIMYSLQHMIVKYFDKTPLVVDSNTHTGLKILYDNPTHVGADRIVNAVAAIRQHGGPVIIIDLGTATTFCAINEQDEYLGGAIMPGIKITADALTDSTDKLNRVELEKPATVLRRDTVSGIQAGLIYGNVGSVDYIVRRIMAELSAPADIPVIATGGLSSMIAADSETITEVNRFLTLEGLYYIYMMNRSKYDGISI